MEKLRHQVFWPALLLLSSLVFGEPTTQTLFDGFLKYEVYKSAHSEGGFVYGPGHHSSAMACFVFDQNNTPFVVLKSGDTRFSRCHRGEPYVLDGFVAGRLDKKGVSGSKIALAELTEEIGGEAVEGSFLPLGQLAPTMPFESTECDAYFLGAARLTGAPTGDGGKMELPGLIGPKFLPPQEALNRMDEGFVSDGGRARALYGRGFHKIGYLPFLGIYVEDYPQLVSRYQTLGLGELVDPRDWSPQSDFQAFAFQPEGKASAANHAVVVSQESLSLGPKAIMIDAKTRHAVKTRGGIECVGPAFANQYLRLTYDRAKVATYYLSQESGPMVRMTGQTRPVLAFAPQKPSVERMDVEDKMVEREQPQVEGARQLGEPSGASSGQSDLYYSYWAQEIRKPGDAESFVTLAEALTLCREGHGDAQTETVLLRLADSLEWCPQLGMSRAAVRRIVFQGKIKQRPH